MIANFIQNYVLRSKENLDPSPTQPKASESQNNIPDIFRRILQKNFSNTASQKSSSGKSYEEIQQISVKPLAPSNWDCKED